MFSISTDVLFYIGASVMRTHFFTYQFPEKKPEYRKIRKQEIRQVNYIIYERNGNYGKRIKAKTESKKKIN
jgi:hypothetical protein